MRENAFFKFQKDGYHPWKHTDISLNHAEEITADVNLTEPSVDDDIFSYEQENCLVVLNSIKTLLKDLKTE